MSRHVATQATTAESTTTARDPAQPLSVAVVRINLKARLVAADLATIVVALCIAVVVQRMLRPVPPWIALDHVALGTLSLPAFAVGASLNRMYQARANERPSEEARNICRTVAVGIGFVVALAFVTQFKELSRLWVAVFAVSSVAGLLAERRLARVLFCRLRRSGRLTRPILIVGTDANAISLMHTYARHPEFGYRVVGFVGDDDIGTRAGATVLGRVPDLDDVLEQTGAVGVVISQTTVNHDELNAITRRLTDRGYHVALSSMLTDIDIRRLRHQQLDGRAMVYVEPVLRDGWRALAKRVFDIVTALALIVITLPVMAVAIVAIRLDGPGPIFFRQRRVGLNGELFTMTKLRTMVPDAEERRGEITHLNEADGPLFKVASDPRLTRVGRVLRKLSIDELPQLCAVVVGDMSMVGPRPALPSEIDHWDETLHDRLRVLPGLTGLWQVSGRSDSSFEQYRRLDLYYVDNWSLKHDLRICLRTIGVVLTGRGAA